MVAGLVVRTLINLKKEFFKLRHHPSAWPEAPLTMKHASLCSSIVQGDGKRREDSMQDDDSISALHRKRPSAILRKLPRRNLVSLLSSLVSLEVGSSGLPGIPISASTAAAAT